MQFFENLSGTIKLLCLVVILWPYFAFADDFTEMPDDIGRLEVFVECSRCHSMQIVNQQGLTRSAWEKLMVWMVEEQGMTVMQEEKETLVVDYLSKHYAPRAEQQQFQGRAAFR
jgi:hypothetical protein